MACGGMIFIKNFKFILFHLIFFMYYCCSINLKRQSEHSGLRELTRAVLFGFVLAFAQEIVSTFAIVVVRAQILLRTMAKSVK